jgi:hypothetical protein
MGLAQILGIHMGVDLGGGDVGMTQELLDCSKISPTCQQMGCKRMPQGMDLSIHTAYEPYFSKPFPDAFP